MAVTIQGMRVSRDWYDVLRLAEAEGVVFQLNSGQRTFAEQQALVARLGVWSPSNKTGAAVPSHSAPHIRTGRQDHALDVQTGPGHDHLVRWLGARGVPMAHTVPGEPWHIETTSAAGLAALAARARKPKTALGRLRLTPLRSGAKSKDVRTVQVWLKRGGLLPKDFEPAKEIGTYGPVAVKAVKRFQTRVGLVADGVIGPKTYAALRRRYSWRVWRRTKPKPAKRPARAKRVIRPDEDFAHIVSNQSARSEPIRLIVVHDTEGANLPGITDLRNLGTWFDNPAADASAHVGVDADGNAARYVEDTRKAWHAAAFNSRALGIEQIGRAAQKTWPERQLRVTAQYIAHWSQKHGIPITHSTVHGVCQHRDLGAGGGGHHDCGPHYPLDRVLEIARALTR